MPPIANHGIWGCLHFLPLVLSNDFLACYDSGTFLSHLTDGGYGFNALGPPGIDMYQMYIVAPMVKAGMTYIRVGLIYKPHGLFAEDVKRCATFLRTFFNRCESEIDVAPSQVYFLQKRRGVGPLCHPMPTWICVNSIIPCPGVINKEGADTVGVPFDIERGSTYPTQLEMEVDHFSKVLQTHLVDVTSNPTLMLDLSCGIKGIPTIDLTKDEAVVHHPPLNGNIADDPEDDLEMPTTAPSPLNHHQTVHDESFQNAAPHTDSDVAPGTSSASAMGIIPTTLLATDKQ